LSDLKQTEKALSDYTEAIKLNPRNSAALTARGRAYLELKNNVDAALRDLQQAITLDPEYAPAYLYLASAYSFKKQEALAALNRGRAYFHAKSYLKSIAELDKAIELEPKLPDAHFERGRAEARQALRETWYRPQDEREAAALKSFK